jgi:hypothetical protein
MAEVAPKRRSRRDAQAGGASLVRLHWSLRNCAGDLVMEQADGSGTA